MYKTEKGKPCKKLNSIKNRISKTKYNKFKEIEVNKVMIGGAGCSWCGAPWYKLMLPMLTIRIGVLYIVQKKKLKKLYIITKETEKGEESYDYSKNPTGTHPSGNSAMAKCKTCGFAIEFSSQKKYKK